MGPAGTSPLVPPAPPLPRPACGGEGGWGQVRHPPPLPPLALLHRSPSAFRSELLPTPEISLSPRPGPAARPAPPKGLGTATPPDPRSTGHLPPPYHPLRPGPTPSARSTEAGDQSPPRSGPGPSSAPGWGLGDRDTPRVASPLDLLSGPAPRRCSAPETPGRGGRGSARGRTDAAQGRG